MRMLAFAKRNVREVLRDPISYIFLLAFPIIMLFVMSMINQGIPKEAQMTVYDIENLSVGICVFGFSFDMLFAALQISSDRNTAFLTRLYSSPMTSADFLLGYSLPLLITSIMQCVVTFLVSALLGATSGYTFSFFNVLLSISVMLPSALLFIGIGILFGTLFNYKAAPPLSSIIITLSGMLGGVWMDPIGIGGTISNVAQILPFYHCTTAARAAINGQFSDIPISLLVVTGYVILFFGAAIFAFCKKSKG